jgi:hypothetical protein
MPLNEQVRKLGPSPGMRVAAQTGCSKGNLRSENAVSWKLPRTIQYRIVRCKRIDIFTDKLVF